MRRKYFGIAIAALATLGPMQAWGGDREIAEQIIQRLKSNRDSGALKDFALDMKVDDGVVLLRGKVAADLQKQLVLAAADGIEGITKVVDEVDVLAQPTPMIPATESVAAAAPEAEPMEAIELPTGPTASPSDSFSFAQALASEAKLVRETTRQPIAVMPGVIQPAAALEETDDNDIISAVVSALGQAKNAGELKGFGVDVQCDNGTVALTGRAASAQQRNAILNIASRVPGVNGVREAISIPAAVAKTTRLPEPIAAPSVAKPMRDAPARLASAPIQRQAMVNPAPVQTMPMQQAMPMQQQMPAMTSQYRMQPQVQAQQAGFGMGGQQMGQPVPMAPHSPVGAPRYDSPNLPNYAWPGYAAHPNYAALTYPQQYSPSAWPYIGPFYPYPQVPLGWRKVSLEWDDGWWFLDFTDR